MSTGTHLGLGQLAGSDQTIPPQSLSHQSHLFDDGLRDVFNFNALANVSDLSDFGGELLNDFSNAGLDGSSLSSNSFFDYDTFFKDHPADLQNETSESTSRMQSQYGAPNQGSDGQGFAAIG